MTAQTEERLLYQGERVAMCTKPLSDYFAMGGFNPRFRPNLSALWRGYVGEWQIIDDRLYLTKLHGTLQDGTEALVATLFPGFPDRVFAHWYSGTIRIAHWHSDAIRIPEGKLLEYLHMGYGGSYERDLFLDVVRGVVVSTGVRRHGKAKSAVAPEGYQDGAMTVFPRANRDESTET